MKNENGLLIAGAILGLISFNQAHAQMQAETKATNGDSVLCYGVNSCKGAGVSAGQIDACNGKDGCNAELKCAGQNSCKGKGLVKLSKKDCLEKGGKIANK